jgi:hypothetical protein
VIGESSRVSTTSLNFTANEKRSTEQGIGGVQEFRSSGVQEFRSSGVQEFRSSGVQEFRSSGVQEFRVGEPGELQARKVRQSTYDVQAAALL